MTYRNFSLGTQLIYKSIHYEVIRYSPNRHQSVTLQEIETGFDIVRPLNELVEALFSGQLEFITPTRINKSKDISLIPLPEEQKIDLSDYPEDYIEIARFRLEAITPLLIQGQRRTFQTVTERSEEMQDKAQKLGQRISARSLYRWMCDFEQGGGELRCLIPNVNRRGGPGKSRLPIETSNLIDSVLKNQTSRREKFSIHDALSIVAARIDEENQFRTITDKLSVPSLPTIARRVDALDIKQKLTGRYGAKIAGKMIKQVGKTTYPELPLERVEFDHTKTDLMVVDDRDNLPLGRCTISFALDMATRYPLGYYLGFEPPSYYTVLECLYHCIAPKKDVRKEYGTEHEWIAYGIPQTLVTDQGKELIGRDLTDACESLGIVLDIAPVKTPEFKGGVERNFRTLNTGFIHQIPGTTFSNFLEKGDYKSEKQALITLNELEKALNVFIVDDYCEKYHRGLGGIPARRWESALQNNFFPRLPVDKDTLGIMLGRVDFRTVQRYGIEFDSIRYNCQDLASIRLKKNGDKVKIKYHPGDLSRIYVFNEYERQYIEVPALDQEYTDNLSLWKHKVIKQYAKVNGDKEDLAALGRAKLKIQEIVDIARSRSKVSKRAKIGRWDNGASPKSLQKSEESIHPKSLSKPVEIHVVDIPKKDIDMDSIDTDMDEWEIAEGKNSSNY